MIGYTRHILGTLCQVYIVPGHIMDSEGIDTFLGTAYNFWNIYITNICSYKYNLGKVKHLSFFF